MVADERTIGQPGASIDSKSQQVVEGSKAAEVANEKARLSNSRKAFVVELKGRFPNLADTITLDWLKIKINELKRIGKTAGVSYAKFDPAVHKEIADLVRASLSDVSGSIEEVPVEETPLTDLEAEERKQAEVAVPDDSQAVDRPPEVELPGEDLVQNGLSDRVVVTEVAAVADHGDTQTTDRLPEVELPAAEDDEDGLPEVDLSALDLAQPAAAPSTLEQPEVELPAAEVAGDSSPESILPAVDLSQPVAAPLIEVPADADAEPTDGSAHETERILDDDALPRYGDAAGVQNRSVTGNDSPEPVGQAEELDFTMSDHAIGLRDRIRQVLARLRDSRFNGILASAKSNLSNARSRAILGGDMPDLTAASAPVSEAEPKAAATVDASESLPQLDKDRGVEYGVFLKELKVSQLKAGDTIRVWLGSHGKARRNPDYIFTVLQSSTDSELPDGKVRVSCDRIKEELLLSDLSAFHELVVEANGRPKYLEGDSYRDDKITQIQVKSGGERAPLLHGLKKKVGRLLTPSDRNGDEGIPEEESSLEGKENEQLNDKGQVNYDQLIRQLDPINLQPGDFIHLLTESGSRYVVEVVSLTETNALVKIIAGNEEFIGVSGTFHSGMSDRGHVQMGERQLDLDAFTGKSMAIDVEDGPDFATSSVSKMIVSKKSDTRELDSLFSGSTESAVPAEPLAESNLQNAQPQELSEAPITSAEVKGLKYDKMEESKDVVRKVRTLQVGDKLIWDREKDKEVTVKDIREEEDGDPLVVFEGKNQPPLAKSRLLDFAARGIITAVTMVSNRDISGESGIVPMNWPEEKVADRPLISDRFESEEVPAVSEGSEPVVEASELPAAVEAGEAEVQNLDLPVDFEAVERSLKSTYDEARQLVAQLVEKTKTKASIEADELIKLEENFISLQSDLAIYTDASSEDRNISVQIDAVIKLMAPMLYLIVANQPNRSEWLRQLSRVESPVPSTLDSIVVARTELAKKLRRLREKSSLESDLYDEYKTALSSYIDLVTTYGLEKLRQDGQEKEVIDSVIKLITAYIFELTSRGIKLVN